MLAHSFHGAQKIADRFENVLGLAATAGCIPSETFAQMEHTYVSDPELRRRLAFEADPAGFCAQWEPQQQALRAKILAAQQALPAVQLPDAMLALAVNICLAVGTEGHRVDITLCKTARALAAWEQTPAVTSEQVEQAALLVLPHRMRRKPFEEAVLDTEKIHALVEEAR